LIANNLNDLNASANSKLGINGGVDNTGYDPVNGYGNESSDRKNLTLLGKTICCSKNRIFGKRSNKL